MKPVSLREGSAGASRRCTSATRRSRRRWCVGWAAWVLAAACAPPSPAESTTPRGEASRPEVVAPPSPAPVPSATTSAAPSDGLQLIEEGDRAVLVNVEGAIQKYEQARRLRPLDHGLLWKLGRAYQKKEDWEKTESTFAEAARLAPEYANYHLWQGSASLKLVEEGDTSRLPAARAAFEQCLKADPNYAECHYYFGHAAMLAANDQVALEHFTRAIELDPTKAYFYPPLAELYSVHKLYAEAQAVLQEGLAFIPQTEESREDLFDMCMLLVQVAQTQGDRAKMIAAVEGARKVAGDTHPEVSFILGSIYATQPPVSPDKAAWQLKSFLKRACRGSGAAKFKEQCEVAQSLLQRIGMAAVP